MPPSWCKASYPCLIELFVQFLHYMDFERVQLGLVTKVECFCNYGSVVCLSGKFKLELEGSRVHCFDIMLQAQSEDKDEA